MRKTLKVRVIAGKAKGKRLKTPGKNWNTRPLTDRAREALFNILAVRVVDARFLDLFAGTGAVGIEALSRGARSAVFVELRRPAAALIRRNLELTGFRVQAEVYAIDALRAVNKLSAKGEFFDLIFVGAPYDSPALAETMRALAETELLKADGVLIAEHRRQHVLESAFDGLEKFREERYGETMLAFYKLNK